MSHLVQLNNVNKSFSNNQVLKNLSFHLEENKIYCLLGESGSGKTTALRLINRLTQPDSGEIQVFGQNIEQFDPIQLRRKMGYSIQGSGLFPHMTIKQNISIIALKLGWTKSQIEHRAEELMALVNLSATQYLNLKPRQLSGGQQQRVGIVRSLFTKPKLLLMDEPFSALDPITRDNIQDEFIELQRTLNFTALVVTHDLHEAFKISHRVFILNQGHLEQNAKPSKIIKSPATEYVKHLVDHFNKSREFKYD